MMLLEMQEPSGGRFPIRLHSLFCFQKGGRPAPKRRGLWATPPALSSLFPALTASVFSLVVWMLGTCSYTHLPTVLTSPET